MVILSRGGGDKLRSGLGSIILKFLVVAATLLKIRWVTSFPHTLLVSFCFDVQSFFVFVWQRTKKHSQTAKNALETIQIRQCLSGQTRLSQSCGYRHFFWLMIATFHLFWPQFKTNSRQDTKIATRRKRTNECNYVILLTFQLLLARQVLFLLSLFCCH